MNDERPIEKLLRRYAQKRRDEAGDPPTLHPATRRLLQGEVARQFPKPAPESKSSGITFFALLARRWAYAVGIFVVLGLAAVMILPNLNKPASNSMLAQKSASEDLAVRESIAPMATPALAPATPPTESQPALVVAESRRNQPLPEPGGGGNNSRLRDESTALSFSVTNGLAAASRARPVDAKSDADAFRSADASKPVSLGTRLDSVAPPTRALTVPPPARAVGEVTASDSLSLAGAAKAGRDEVKVTADGFNESRQAATPPPAATAASAVVSTGAQDKNFFARGGGVEKDAEQVYSQSFANVAPEQLRAKAAKVKAETPMMPVLVNFQVQQVGNQLRVVDGDGSTYLGELNTSLANNSGTAGVGVKKTAAYGFESADRSRAQAPAGAVTAYQPATQNYQWRVEGTNRTLNQNVVFTWNFVEATNTQAASELRSLSGAVNQDASKLPRQFPSLLNNSVINGRAQLGPTQQIEVNAVPVKP